MTLALLLNTQTALLTSYSSLYLVSSLEPWLPYSQCQTWQDPSPTCPPLDQLAPNSVQLSTEEFWLTNVLGSDRSGVLVDGGLTSLHSPWPSTSWCYLAWPRRSSAFPPAPWPDCRPSCCWPSASSWQH